MKDNGNYSLRYKVISETTEEGFTEKDSNNGEWKLTDVLFVLHLIRHTDGTQIGTKIYDEQTQDTNIGQITVDEFFKILVYITHNLLKFLISQEDAYKFERYIDILQFFMKEFNTVGFEKHTFQ